MVWHLVLMKPKPDLPREDQRALIDAFDRACRDIPTVRDVRVGRRFTFGAGYEAVAPDAADYMIAIAFADRDGLQTYLRHPAHQELGERFGQAVSAGMVYDFEEAELRNLGR